MFSRRFGGRGFDASRPGPPAKETLIKAFPAPDLRCEAANSLANSCDPPEAFREMLIKSAFP